MPKPQSTEAIAEEDWQSKTGEVHKKNLNKDKDNEFLSALTHSRLALVKARSASACPRSDTVLKINLFLGCLITLVAFASCNFRPFPLL